MEAQITVGRSSLQCSAARRSLSANAVICSRTTRNHIVSLATLGLSLPTVANTMASQKQLVSCDDLVSWYLLQHPPGQLDIHMHRSQHHQTCHASSATSQ